MLYKKLEMETFKESQEAEKKKKTWDTEGNVYIAFQNAHMASDKVISKGFCGGCMRNKLFAYRSRTLGMWDIRFAPLHFRNGPSNFKIPGWNSSKKKKKCLRSSERKLPTE